MEDSIERCLNKLDFRNKKEVEKKRLQREAKVKILKNLCEKTFNSLVNVFLDIFKS
jgi:hypothetical protein